MLHKKIIDVGWCFVFFFQAEDGIRDLTVTGVQTCALPISYGRWPLAIVAPITAVLITLHSSLQHEIVHGHPTRWSGLNRLLAIVPLSLWMPYERYRRSHRVHHIDQRLTDPLDDPESYYWTPQDWARLKPVTRVLVQI